MRRAFDIRKHLSPYFSAEQVRQLRGLQGLCGAVISGSSALQFFDRSVYPESDLDIYVPVGHVRFFCHWLLSCGYSHYPNSSQPRLWPREHRIVLWAPFTTPPAYTMPPVDSVFDFRKDGLLIQVVSTRDTPIEAILNFHSSTCLSDFPEWLLLAKAYLLACVMNLITYDGAYSLYPRSTFEDRESLIMSRNPLRSSQSRDDARLKYMRRGWKMVYGSRELLESQDKTSLGFSGITRHIGDSYTWTIPFDSAQIDLPEFTLHKGKVISLVTANSWRLSVSGLVHPVDDSNRVAWVPAPDDVEESAAVAIYDARVCTCAGLQFSIMLSGAIDSSQLYDLFAEVNLYRGSGVR